MGRWDGPNSSGDRQCSNCGSWGSMSYYYVDGLQYCSYCKPATAFQNGQLQTQIRYSYVPQPSQIKVSEDLSISFAPGSEITIGELRFRLILDKWVRIVNGEEQNGQEES